MNKRCERKGHCFKSYIKKYNMPSGLKIDRGQDSTIEALAEKTYVVICKRCGVKVE